jgi:hypothetical protein
MMTERVVERVLKGLVYSSVWIVLDGIDLTKFLYERLLTLVAYVFADYGQTQLIDQISLLNGRVEPVADPNQMPGEPSSLYLFLSLQLTLLFLKRF